MIEHKTSWSTLAKNMQGRTENSIKNYFYSTIRRIQMSKAMLYAKQLKEGKKSPELTREQFASHYEIDSLNELAKQLMFYLWEQATEETELKTYFL